MVQEDSGFGAKCFVVPLGLRECPAEPSRKVLAEDRLRILFVGDDAIRKGLADLHESLLPFPMDRVEVRVAGQIDVSPVGRRLAAERMDLLGRVPRSMMRDQYAWADILVLPSVSDTFGLVILEAMSYGVPVIASTNTGAIDVIRDGHDGFLIAPMNPDELSDRIARLLADPALRRAMSQAAFERARNFSLDRYTQQLVSTVRDSCDARFLSDSRQTACVCE